MANKLSSIFQAVKKEKGPVGATRMILMTGITEDRSKTLPDTPEMVKKMADAYKEITGKPCPIT
jgi:hypothetical protein